MIDDVKNDAESKMKKSIEAVKHDFQTIRYDLPIIVFNPAEAGAFKRIVMGEKVWTLFAK